VERPRWQALVLTIPASLQEELAGSLGAGSLGVEVLSSGAATSTLRVCLPSDATVDPWVAAAREALRALALDPEESGLRVETIEDEPWVARYQAALSPIPVGARFLVVPGEPPFDFGGRTPMFLTPGMAFGTGEHETTSLCVEGLDLLVTPGSVWADVGTGTGILSVVATRCGAAAVYACDTDPEAIEVAKDVLEGNGVAGTVELVLGSAADLPRASADGVVVNIESRYFLSHARSIASLLRNRGWLLASGLLVEDVAEVSASLEGAGIELVETYERGPWAMIQGRREPR
jgi:ribosomal protein L11 methyltransferase